MQASRGWPVRAVSVPEPNDVFSWNPPLPYRSHKGTSFSFFTNLNSYHSYIFGVENPVFLNPIQAVIAINSNHPI